MTTYWQNTWNAGKHIMSNIASAQKDSDFWLAQTMMCVMTWHAFWPSVGASDVISSILSIRPPHCVPLVGVGLWTGVSLHAEVGQHRLGVNLGENRVTQGQHFRDMLLVVLHNIQTQYYASMLIRWSVSLRVAYVKSYLK